MRLQTFSRAMTAFVTAIAASLSRLAEQMAHEDRSVELRRAHVRIGDHRPAGRSK